MLRGRVVAVVVPARNEARWIAGTLASIPAFVDHVVVVDDASGDDTAALARRAGPRGTTVTSHESRRGVGGAIATGYRIARDLGADAIAVMAGDGQMHPDDLAVVLAPILDERAGYVKGDRTRDPSVWDRMPTGRLLGTMALAWLTRRATGLSIRDAQCGFTAITAAAVDRIDLDGLWPGYGYCNDLLAAVARAGIEVREVPVRPVYAGQSSGLRPWHAASYVFILSRAALRRALSSAGVASETLPGQRRDPARPRAAGTPPAPPRAPARAETTAPP
jgi:glycosyltransferase involved in cell wall biosynthesis